jgi:hypothetical protein
MTRKIRIKLTTAKTAKTCDSFHEEINVGK